MPVSNITVRTTCAFALPQAEDTFSYVCWFFPPLICLAGLAFPFLKVNMELLSSPYLNSAQTSLGESGKKPVSKQKARKGGLGLQSSSVLFNKKES